MKIADLFFSGRLDDGPLQVDAKKAGAKAGESFGSRFAASVSKSNLGKGLVSGLGLGAGISAFGALDSAVSKSIGFLFDAADAARADEESQARLGQSLMANIPNWNGNTDAIEETITARQKLGFEDEEQRKSLAILVAATHDVGKAMKIQATAMDLARLKGISLEDASNALIKVEGGQYRALKALGIQLPKNATAEEALTAVQKVATGQAETYANTNEGKLLVSQIKVNEKIEELGYKIMPALADGMGLLVDAIDPAITALGLMADAANLLLDPTQLIINKQREQAEATRDAMQAAADAEAESLAYAHSLLDVRENSRETARPVRDLGNTYQDTAEDAEDASKRMRTASNQLRNTVLTDAQKMVEGYFDVLITEDNLAATNAEIAAQRRIIASSTATRKEKEDAAARLHQLQKDQYEALSSLAKAGATSSKQYTGAIKGLFDKLRNAHQKDRAVILDEIRLLNILAAKAALANLFNGRGNGGYNTYGGGRASGGPVSAGTAYIVGEHRPELFVPKVDGTIIPRVPTWSQPAMATGGDTYNVNLLDRMEVRSVRDIGSGLRMLGEQGHLARRRR